MYRLIAMLLAILSWVLVGLAIWWLGWGVLLFLVVVGLVASGMMERTARRVMREHESRLEPSL
jgi:hypothetical protein